MKLVFATNNKNKIAELKAALGDQIELLTLAEVGCTDDIPETRDTLEGNALQKAEYLKNNYGYDCFADDTGLEVAALNGAPGVYSARYAGPQKQAEDNMNKLLNELKLCDGRQARFRTAIALILNGEQHVFEGEVKGEITRERSGAEGFGYDPVFQPEGYNRTFAEMNMIEKNAISHRGKAVKKLINFLNEYV